MALAASRRTLYGQQPYRQLRRLPVPVLLLLLVSVCALHAHQLYTMSGTQKLCGQALSDAMEVVCVKGYNGWPLPRLAQKRVEQQSMEKQEEKPELAKDPAVVESESEPERHVAYALSPLLSSIYGAEVLIRTMRRQRRQGGGVYDECCRNSCTIQELAAYCRQR